MIIPAGTKPVTKPNDMLIKFCTEFVKFQCSFSLPEPHPNVFSHQNDDFVLINRFDLGQKCKLGETTLDRYTTPAHLLKWLKKNLKNIAVKI